jgi:hypothetical protein
MVLPTSGSISISGINSCARFTNGNMGINTTSPNYNLDIDGTLKATTITIGTMLATTSISSGAVNATNSTVTNFVATSITAGSIFATNNINSSTSIIVTNPNSGSSAYSALTLVTDQGNFNIFKNSTTRTVDGGVNTVTMRNDGGPLRLQSNTGLGIWVGSTGNVGINTTTPSGILNVNGDSTGTNGSLLITGSDLFGHSLHIASQASHKRLGFNHNGTVGNIFSYEYGTGPQNLILQYAGGNVGINTSTPSTHLHVAGGYSNSINSTTGSLRLEPGWIGHAGIVSFFQANGTRKGYIGYGLDNTAFEFHGEGSRQIVLFTNDIERMTVTSTGNVGIGTNSPSAKLNVIGGTDVFGPLRVGGNSSSSEFIINLGTTGVGGDRAGYLYGSGTHIELFNQQNGHIVFGTNNASRVQIAANGRLTVGGLNGSYPLTVFGSSNSGSVVGYAGWGGQYVWQNQTASYDVSIYGQNFMMAGQGFVSVSDQRIKKDIVDIEDGESLNIIRQIQPKRYRYIDEYKRGTDYVYGFIAQQVREVLPSASGFVKDVIPSIITSATVSYDSVNDITTVTLVDNKQHNLTSENINSQVRFFDENDTNTDLELHEIVSANIFKVKGELKGTNTFVYGVEVDDFHTLNKDVIFTVALAALQQVDKELQETKQTVNDLVRRIQALENARN